MIKTRWTILPLALFALGLNSCGKKPLDIEPPPDVSTDRFPQTYPTDPPLRDIPTPTPVDPQGQAGN
jgi:hypothetical protein